MAKKELLTRSLLSENCKASVGQSGGALVNNSNYPSDTLQTRRKLASASGSQLLQLHSSDEAYAHCQCFMQKFAVNEVPLKQPSIIGYFLLHVIILNRYCKC
ncbi:unnamed protein product [Litomosoides sigmodontis]|uniref:Uncharacterized protein n=1 Tax=Litomosoides sigmodontis TaxID=42156 RepID=A0A3P6TM47_LITSI|nr:unnamed protein product [Litomosoides sigmodontis]